MPATKKYFYLIVMFCLISASWSFHLWAGTGEGSKKVISSDKQKAERQQEEAPAQNHSKISFDSTSYDAREVWEGEKVSHTFIVKNTGKAELNIEKVKAG